MYSDRFQSIFLSQEDTANIFTVHKLYMYLRYRMNLMTNYLSKSFRL